MEDKEGKIVIQISKEGKITDVHSEPKGKYSIRALINAFDCSKNFLLNMKV